MDRALVVILGFVAAAVTVLAVAAVWLTAGADADGADGAAVAADGPAVIEGVSFPPVDHDVDAAAALVEAWARWRTATFVSIGTWTRTVDSMAEPLTGEVYVAQEPPRRLVVRLGAVVERTGGTVAACSPVEEDTVPPACLAGEGLGYDELVDRELGLVRQYVGGETRIYDVGVDEHGCFEAELFGPALASPWGRWARFCFDDGSGALQSALIRRPSAIDVESTHTIRTDVTDADFG